MNSRLRLARSASLSVASLALLVACSAGGATPQHSASSGNASHAATNSGPVNAASLPTTPPKLPVIASSDADPNQGNQGSGLDTRGMTLQINSAKRDSSGIVTLKWTVENSSGHWLDAFNKFWDYLYRYTGGSVSDEGLIDQAKQVKYHPLIDTEMTCYCSSGGSSPDAIAANGEMSFTDMYEPSPDVTKVDVEVAGFKPVKNIPIT